MPTPSRISVSPSPGAATSKPSSPLAPSPPAKPEAHFGVVDDSVWSPELQERFHRALVNANSPSSKYSSGVSSGEFAPGKGHNSRSDEQTDVDPFAEMLASLSTGASGAPGSDMFSLLQQIRQGTQATSPDVDTLQRDKAIRRTVQLVTAWLLLACFVFFLEPSAYRTRVGSLDVGRWTRWAVLGEERNMLELLQTFIVQPQPVSEIYLSIEVIFESMARPSSGCSLHWKLFSTLTPFGRSLYVAIGHTWLFLTPGIFQPIRSDRPHQDALGWIKRLMGVFNVVMFLLNDLGSIIFGLGLVVFFAGYVTPK